MDLQNEVTRFIQQFIKSITKHVEAITFLRTHRVWEGFWKYGWVMKGLLIFALISGLAMFSNVVNFFQKVTTAGSIDALGARLSSYFSEVHLGSLEFFYTGGMKYVVLIFSEILIFHVIRRTIETLTQEDLDGSFKAFWAAQKRMIFIAIRSYFMEMLTIILVGVILKLVGLGFIKPVFAFFIQAFYIGFMFLDNYNERFGMTINESMIAARQYAGICVGVGMIAYILLLIPLIGALVGTIIGAVAATLTIHFYTKNEDVIAIEDHEII